MQGKVSELKLYVHSSFKHKMQVKSLSVIGDDPRFTFDTSAAAKISPGQKSYVGTVRFSPGADCGPDTEEPGAGLGCYTGFSPDTKFGRPWYLGLAMPLNLGEMDLAVVHSLWSRMKAVSSPNSVFNVTLKLDTSEVRGFLFSARASLSWPLLASTQSVRFPLTQLGNSTRSSVVVSNPSSQPLLVHIVPMSAYPEATSVINLLPNRKHVPYVTPDTAYRISTMTELEHLQAPTNIFDPADSAMFTIESVVDVDNPDEPLETFGDNFSEKFGVEVSTATYPIMLRPGQSAKVTVSFTPVEPAGPRASVLFVRNNLTGVDVVDLLGAGAIGDIKFGNRRPGSVIHAFEVTEKHLKDCEKAATSKQAHVLPNLTVKRPFTARNSGEVSIWVTGFEIDGKQCEGYGFKVLDCEPFLLAANDSKKINIAFTPDFTLSRVTRTLTLKTSLGDQPGQGDVKYFLAATVPPQLLALCSKALPRPYWEKMIYYGTLSLLSAGFCCVMIAAFFEADRILKFCFLLASPTQQNFMAENCKPFDLKEIARNAVLESEKRIEAAETERNNSSSKLAPTSKMISSQNFSNLDMLKKDNSLAFLNSIQDLKTNNKDVSNTQTPKFSMIKKVASVIRFLFRTVFKSTPPVTQPPETPKTIEKINEAIKEIKEVKRVETTAPATPIVKKSPDIKKTKAGNKKPVNKPKLTTQNSVNDEAETSSTTTESSNAEELAETFTKGITITNTNVSDNSAAAEPSKKKKKAPKPKVEEISNKENNNKPQKKKVEKAEVIKQEQKPEKTRMPQKSSTESPKVSTPPVKAESPPPPQPKQKQEAKVKGVPKEASELRRQQSAPAYDRPPRLQGQGSSGRNENYGNVEQPRTSIARPEPPRAIIRPEVKQNPGSQFGPIGCKVPSTHGSVAAKSSTWNDSPAAPAPVPRPLMSSSVSVSGQAPSGNLPPTLLPPPGLTIMQQLQAERRAREEEYVRRQNNWPGFSDQPATSSAGNMGAIGNIGTAAGNYVDNLWDTPTQAPAGLWGTLDNVWPSSVFNSGFNDGRNMNRDADTSSLGFDSLSLSSIWSSAGAQVQHQETETAGGDNTWSSLFTENKKDL